LDEMIHAHADQARNTRSAAEKLRDLSGRVGALGLWVPIVLYCAGIFYLSSLTVLPGPIDIIPDKIGHIVLYAGLGFLVARYLRIAHGFSGFAICTLAAIFCLIYGISDEFHQYFVEGRNAEIGDVVADFVGGVAGGSMYIVLRRDRLQTDTKPCAPAGGV
jgi:VanZ family protein